VFGCTPSSVRKHHTLPTAAALFFLHPCWPSQPRGRSLSTVEVGSPSSPAVFCVAFIPSRAKHGPTSAPWFVPRLFSHFSRPRLADPMGESLFACVFWVRHGIANLSDTTHFPHHNSFRLWCTNHFYLSPPFDTHGRGCPVVIQSAHLRQLLPCRISYLRDALRLGQTPNPEALSFPPSTGPSWFYYPRQGRSLSIFF